MFDVSRRDDVDDGFDATGGASEHGVGSPVCALHLVMKYVVVLSIYLICLWNFVAGSMRAVFNSIILG